MRNIVGSRSATPRNPKNVQRSAPTPYRQATVSGSYKYLQSDMDALLQNFNRAKEIIDLKGDSFIQRAEMFYSARPELSEILDFMYNKHRALADRYETLNNRIQKEVPVFLREKYGLDELASGPLGKSSTRIQSTEDSKKNLIALFESGDVSNGVNARRSAGNPMENGTTDELDENEKVTGDGNENDDSAAEGKEMEGGGEEEVEEVEEDENAMSVDELKALVRDLRKKVAMEKAVQAELIEYNSTLTSELQDFKNPETTLEEDVECVDKEETSAFETKGSRKKGEEEEREGEGRGEPKDLTLANNDPVNNTLNSSSTADDKNSEAGSRLLSRPSFISRRLEKELETLKLELVECQNQNEQLQKVISNSKSGVNESQDSADSESAEKNSPSTEDSLSTLQSQVAKLQIALNASYRDTQSLESEFLLVQSDLETAQQDIFALSDEIARLKDTINQLQVESNGYKKKNSALKSRVTSLETELKNFKKKEKKFEDEIEKLLFTMDSLKLEMHATERDLLRINAQLDVLCSENSDLRKAIAQTDNSKRINESMKEELNQLKSAMLAKDQDIKILKDMKIQTMKVLSASIEELRQENRYLLKQLQQHRNQGGK